MRAARRGALPTLLLTLPTLAQAAEEPRPLSFTTGVSRYEVPTDGFDSVGFVEQRGMEICMTEPVQAEVAAFTENHVGAVVKVAIGDTEVTRVQIVEPYADGCITWPNHPMVAANDIAMLTGEAPRVGVPAEATGE